MARQQRYYNITKCPWQLETQYITNLQHDRIENVIAVAYVMENSLTMEAGDFSNSHCKDMEVEYDT